MGQPQNNFFREAKKNLKQARQEAEQFRQEQKSDKQPAEIPENYREQARQMLEQKFDALQPGDSLREFGFDITIAKKNKKSVVTNMGCKFSKQELCQV